jgi:cytosine/adenosine deaminase-related metal-dependent hydrolase
VGRELKLGPKAVQIFARKLVNAEDILESVVIGAEKGVITGLRYSPSGCPPGAIDLGDSILFPALINAHDHLKYSWHERIGSRRPYESVYEWLPELYASVGEKIETRLALSDVYWLGVYKSIFAGVSTVLNHSSRLPDGFVSGFPIRIFENYARALGVRSDPRGHTLGNALSDELLLAKTKGIPFVVHLAEGKDHFARRELEILARHDIKPGRFVFVHCIDAGREEIEQIARMKATVVWCPTSNQFIIGQEGDIPLMLSRGINVALGTDSSTSGPTNLLRETEVALERLRRWQRPEAEKTVLRMVTVNPGKALGLEPRVGTIAPGASLDMLAIRPGSSSDRVEALFHSDYRDICLLTCAGAFVYGDAELWKAFGRHDGVFSSFRTRGVEKRIAGNPAAVVNLVRSKLKEHTGYSFIPRELQQT